MKNKIYANFDEAVAGIRDGSTIMFPGFGGVGIPRNLIDALRRQGAKNLTAISNGHGVVDDMVVWETVEGELPDLKMSVLGLLAGQT